MSRAIDYPQKTIRPGEKLAFKSTVIYIDIFMFIRAIYHPKFFYQTETSLHSPQRKNMG
jgi:hypothetical protein